jgi:hypothetical protein
MIEGESGEVSIVIWELRIRREMSGRGGNNVIEYSAKHPSDESSLKTRQSNSDVLEREKGLGSP